MKSAILVAMVVSLSGCAAMMTQWREANCHYDGAYKAGMNDARSGEEMNQAFSNSCDVPSQQAAEQGYREGYTAGIGGAPQTINVAVSAPRQSNKPWKCEQAYGQEECGYECVTAYGEIACAKQPHHDCVTAYGEVRCGQNCRAEYGDIECDQ